MNRIYLIIPILFAVILITTSQAFAVDSESKSEISKNDNTAKRDVINKFDTWTNLSYADKVKKVIVEDYENNSKVLIDRLCPYGQNMINGTCVIPNPPPVLTEICGNNIDDDKDGQVDEGCPVPAPANGTTAIIFTGDVEGTSVRDGIKNANPALVVVSGDLGYDSSLSWFKANYVNVFKEKLRCNIGNHDAPEDGSNSIYTESKKLCGELWFAEVANNTTLIIGFNSNGNLNTLLGQAQNYVMNSTNMEGIKNVIITSHKPGHAAPNSHHPVSEDPEVKTFVDSLKGKISSNEIEINGHNHVSAKAPGKYYTSGAGGKGHYECGKDATWTFCNNQSYGYLKFVIDNNTGKILSDKFYSSNGSVLG